MTVIMKFVWLSVFVYFTIFFLIVDLVNHSGAAFVGWMISAFMIGWFAKRIIGEHAEDNHDVS